MVWIKSVQLWTNLSSYQVARYWQVHLAIGLLNVSIYYSCFAFGFGTYVATASGHLVHASLAFYVDRFYTYQALSVRKAVSWWKYGVVESITFSLINLFLFVLVTKQGYEHSFVRWGPGMLIPGLFHFFGNKYWTFR